MEVELQPDTGAEQQAVGGAAEVEHAERIPLLHPIPACTVISQLDTSAIPTGTTHIRPILGLSASMKMSARVATEVRNGWELLGALGSAPAGRQSLRTGFPDSRCR